MIVTRARASLRQRYPARYRAWKLTILRAYIQRKHGGQEDVWNWELTLTTAIKEKKTAWFRKPKVPPAGPVPNIFCEGLAVGHEATG